MFVCNNHRVVEKRGTGITYVFLRLGSNYHLKKNLPVFQVTFFIDEIEFCFCLMCVCNITEGGRAECFGHFLVNYDVLEKKEIWY